MLNIKLSVFIASLIAAALVGGVSSTILVHMLTDKSSRDECSSGNNIQARGVLIHTERSQGY
ncbi:MAG: hypothetical protein WAW86_10465 [Gammaproteobacteria bacterium]